MKSILILLITAAFLTLPGNISMHGVKIHSDKKSLESLKLEIVAREGDMVKYRTENGNDFSITCEKDKVVYMENDWSQNSKGRQSLFSNFLFGQTTLKDIRSRFSTNGFTYTNRNSIKTDTDLIMFNCFEFESKNNEVLVVITKVSLKEDVTEENIASTLKLEAIIIADKTYLDGIWGESKVFDPNYKKIRPAKTATSPKPRKPAQ